MKKTNRQVFWQKLLNLQSLPTHTIHRNVFLLYILFYPFRTGGYPFCI